AEYSIEESRRRTVSRHPRRMPEKTMNLVRQNQLLEWHALRSQSAREINRLMEPHVPIVVPLDEQHRRLPRLHRRHGRGLPRHLARPIEIRRLVEMCAPAGRRESTARARLGRCEVMYAV